MSDEDKKKITSEPPPPTDEIDGEWGEDSAAKDQPAPPVAPARAAEASTPPEMKAASAHEAEEEDEEAEEADEDEDEDEDDDAGSEHAHDTTSTATAGSDWLPDWAPYAVLAALVSLSVLVGLGLVGGPAAGSEGDKAAAPTKPAAKKTVANPGAIP